MTNTYNTAQAKQIIAKYLKAMKVQCEEPPGYYVVLDTVTRFLNKGLTELAYSEANKYSIEMSRAGY